MTLQDAAVPSARLAALQRMSVEELDQRFESGAVPSFDQFVGPTRGVWLHRDQQPWWAAIFVKLALDSPWARWAGKAFVTPFAHGRTGAGCNLFDNRWAPLRFQMGTRIQPAVADGQPCLTLIYPLGSAMFGLIDDLREVEGELLLGQMWYRFPWDTTRRFVGYFALER